jgi:hypothetical protein
MTDAIDEQIEKLEESKDSLDKQKEKIDDQIKKLEEYVKKWEEIQEEFEATQNAIIANELDNNITEEAILGQRLDILNNFKKNYLKILDDIAKAEKGIGNSDLKPTTHYDGSSDSNSGGSSGNSGGNTGGNQRKWYQGDEPKPDKYEKILGKGYYKWATDTVKFTDKGQGNVVGSDGTKAKFITIGGKKFIAQTLDGTQYLLPVEEAVISMDKQMPVYQFELGDPAYSKTAPPTYASGTPYASGGLTNVDENGNELLVRNPARGRMTYLEQGDGVLNAGLTRNIMRIANNPEAAVSDALISLLKKMNTQGNDGIGGQVISISNLNLPNVSDVNGFIKELKLLTQNR